MKDQMDIFKQYYETNFWRDPESVSGAGSSMAATATIRDYLPTLFSTMGITNVLDAACGDFQWMKTVIEKCPDLKYLGEDIVPELIMENRERFIHPNWEFQVCDITRPGSIRRADLIFARDVLVHFDNRTIEKTLKNFRASGGTWLLATTFPGANPNADIHIGEWRPVDLSAIRFGLGPPGLSLLEGQTGEFSNKSLGLWRINQ